MYLDRRRGDLWRQISEQIEGEISNGSLSDGDRLPASSKLAARFGVHQHTVLKAITHLQAEGRVRVEQGRGTFVTTPQVPFKLGTRTWFEENLSKVQLQPERRILSIIDEPASSEVAEMLGLMESCPVKRINLLGSGSGAPIYVGRIYVDPMQNRIVEAFEEFDRQEDGKISVSKILIKAGFPAFRKGKIRIRSRLPTPTEASLLGISYSQPVTETLSPLCCTKDEPIAFSYAIYCSQRVELTVDLNEQ